MGTTVQIISWQGIAWAFVPVVVAIIIIGRWQLAAGTAVYALARMLAQLLAVGLVLTYIFAADSAPIMMAVLVVMITAASWIAMHPLQDKNPRVFGRMLIAIGLGGGLTLALITQMSLDLDHWYNPRYTIPLAGMIFANAMNAVSLCAERFASEQQGGASYIPARTAAMRAAMIPLINSLFAVGLVSLPGMMTGQILSGVSPVIAAKYQIIVMCMIFGASVISAAIYVRLNESR